MSAPAAGEISLYIPARNCARTLSAAIASVRGQSLQPADFFLVLDTRSEDDTADIARGSGLRIVEQHDGRLGHARNLALQACRTPWLASCDSDVTLERGWLAALAAAAGAGPAPAAIGGRTEERLITAADRWRAVNLPHNWGLARFDNPFMLVSEMLAQVAAFRTIGGYRADLQSWEDSDACQRLRQAGFALRYQPDAVAWHDRRDSIASVLELRWFYASYRQRAHFDSLAGLTEKLATNRTYVLQSLSQTLYGEHPAVTAISLLLWLHHIVRDLQEVLERWPLLDSSEREACLSEARFAAASPLAARWPALAALAAVVWPEVRTPRDAAAPRTPAPSLSATRGYRRYLAAVRDAGVELVAGIPADFDAAIERSARCLAANDLTAFDAPPSPEPDAQALAAEPLRPAWCWGEVAELLAACTDRVPRRVETLGDVLPVEAPLESDTDSTCVRLIPHLERYAAPLDALQTGARDADLIVCAYQPPLRLIRGCAVLSARDLATGAAQRDLEILHFDTRAGLTRMVLRPRRCAARLASGSAVAATRRA